MAAYDVCAIGNALVDILAESTDAFLSENKIAKGAMTLVDAEAAALLYDLMGPTVQMSGGSAANTVAGIASLGGHPAYMGKVNADTLGSVFRHDLHAQGVAFATTSVPERRQISHAVETERRRATPTGRCIILVTPDAQRSMNTYLGAAVEFGPEDIQPDVIRSAEITYLEGYLFDPPDAKKAFYTAAELVRAAGKKLALTLSDTFCVERHRAAFHDLIKDEVDILFANQHELMALYQTKDIESAITAARAVCPMVVTTMSEKGAVIATPEGIVRVKAEPVEKLVDTTGAGDLFAAGFLFGLTQDRGIEEAGRIGALAAAEVIGHYGPRPQTKLKDLI